MEYKVIKGADGYKYVVFRSSKHLDDYLKYRGISPEIYSFRGFNNAVRIEELTNDRT